MPLLLAGTAATMISHPIYSFAAEETTVAEAEASNESDETDAAGESSEDGENSESTESIEETTEAVPENDYYVIVSKDDGAKLYQQASTDSSLSINIPIPKNTILHVLSEETGADGSTWGFVNYADLKEGYVKLTELSTIQAKTAKQVVEEKFNGNWGQDFITVNGSGTPVSFNSLSKEELEAAKESNAAAEKNKSNSVVVESNEDESIVETNEDGSPVVEVWMETNENGEPVETDEDGNIIESETEPEVEEKKSSGFSIVSFLIGFITVILLEVIVAGVMILLRRLKRKGKGKGSEEETPPDGADEGGKKKKKGLKLPVPKLPIPKISLPKVKFSKIKIGGKKKKKEEKEEDS